MTNNLIVQKPCNRWLPEFGADNECREGRVIDIDVYHDYGFGNVYYPPCPFCNAEEFDKALDELAQDGVPEEANALIEARDEAKKRMGL